MRTENQDSVLPLVQVICTQLYEREKSQPDSDGVITREDLDAIKGVEGGLKAFAEDALERSLRLDPADREAFKALFSQLYNRQPDGTLTTWLMPRGILERPGAARSRSLGRVEAAKSVRLLREDELRIEGTEPRRYIRLGHDALAKVAAAWQAERDEEEHLQRERAQVERERKKRRATNPQAGRRHLRRRRRGHPLRDHGLWALHQRTSPTIKPTWRRPYSIQATSNANAARKSEKRPGRTLGSRTRASMK